jgi:FkbM family methyltransferase
MDSALLLRIAAPLRERLTLVDVGVRWGFEERWCALAPAAKLVGFDADESECAHLAKRHRALPDATFAPVALSDRDGEATLHIAEEPGSSSLLEPAANVLERRIGMAGMREVGRQSIQTTTLAAWARGAGLARVDGLKLDVQGAELQVLKGAGALLDGVLALDLEVEFNPLYKDQPLFAEVDSFLRGRGFALWRLGELTHYALPDAGRAGTVRERQVFADGTFNYAAGGGQLVWGRARYVRQEVADPPAGTSPEAHLRAALVAWAFQLDDLAIAGLRRAAADDQSEELDRLVATFERRSQLRALRQHDWLGTAKRYVRVAALASRGHDDEDIARQAGLTLENVALLRRLQRWPRRKR